MTCFTKIRISLLLLTELYKNSHSFIIRFDLSASIKGSFAIDTQMSIVLFFLDNRYTEDRSNYSIP